MSIHTFEACLTWGQKQIASNHNKKVYTKSHTIQIVNKLDLAVSAAKFFKGDPELYNPEDLLLSSLVSCHMMSYLYVCEQHKIEILSYTDSAQAILETHPNGSGKIIEVILNPTVVIYDESQVEKAIALHTEANKLCFIANSCNFPVRHFAKCLSKE